MNLPNLIAQNQGLTIGGWIVMIGCIGMVCALLVFCFWRVLGLSSSENE